jgi:hypothetical protein
MDPCSVQGPVASSCDQVNKPVDSAKYGEFLESRPLLSSQENALFQVKLSMKNDE